MRSIYTVGSGLLAMHASSLALWYARMPHRTTLASDIWPMAGVFTGGLLLALLAPGAKPRHIASLGVLMAALTGGIHVLAGALGAPVDLGNPGMFAPLVMLMAPLCVALTFAGAAIVWLIRIGRGRRAR